MPSFLTRPKNHVRRPRSGQFDAQKLKQYLNDNQQQSTQQHSEELGPGAEGGRSPAALIMDSSGAGSSNSSSGSSSLSMRTADHGQSLRQRHNRVVSLSWPGETWHAGREPQEPPLRWEELEKHSNRMTGTISPRGTAYGGEARKEEQQEEEEVAPLPAVGAAAAAAAAPARAAAAAAAPSKRQRQMDWANNTKASSGPIDIPLSPGDQQQGGLPSTFHQDSLLRYHAALTTGEEDVASGRGGRAATDAGAWYPCWPRTRPDEDSSGDGAGPPEHILIWERSFMRSASLQQRAIVMEEPLEAGLGSRRVSDGSGGGVRGEVQGEDEDDEDDDDADDCPERRMSDQSMFEMDF